MKLYKLNLLIGAVVLLFSCGDGGDDTEPTPPETPEPTVVSPSATTLIFPNDNTECNTGVIINENQSNVTFEWNASENTDSYEINIRNLNTSNVSKTASTTTTATISIARGTPFAWFVISKANGTTDTATSPEWQFYNEGPGITNYAPFPAEAISPARGENITTSSTTINLEWSASDVDEDILNYEVFFDTSENPTTSLGVVNETTIPVAVTQGTIYRWKIITRDGTNNTSTSEIFDFKTN